MIEASEDHQKTKSKSSPIGKLVILTGIAFAILAMLVITTQTFILLVSLISTISLAFYLLAALKRKRKKTPARGTQIPLAFLFGLLFVPIAFAGYYTFGTFNQYSVYSMIVAFGMTLTFMYSMVNVPLTVYHKRMEETRRALLSTPLVTIIVPAFNEEKSLRRALDSVVEADYPNKEIIVIDDGSTDNTYAIARNFRDRLPQDRYLVISRPNGGKSTAINYAIRYAKGDYIIAIDADSVMGRDSIKEIMKYFQEPDVVAVGGNIKVKNRNSLLTYCQALEYLVGINLFKRAYDVFGVVMVVPGPLGGFRKKVLLERGEYDKNTLAEDFDTTIKVLKTGRAVQASTYAMSFTEAPESIDGLYKQRLRWNRGNLQTLLKHRDIVMNSRFGMLQKYGYPLIFLTMIALPFLSMIVASFIVLALLNGEWFFVLMTFLVFVALEVVLTAIAIIMDEEDWKLILVAPLFVIGYKHLVDIITIKSVLDVIFHRNLTWTSDKVNVKDQNKTNSQSHGGQSSHT
jgi:cellulose synthase/poly-beta-1,6-N-acetylglucosamine synthase-like glycosyltransferase